MFCQIYIINVDNLYGHQALQLIASVVFCAYYAYCI